MAEILQKAASPHTERVKIQGPSVSSQAKIFPDSKSTYEPFLPRVCGVNNASVLPTSMPNQIALSSEQQHAQNKMQSGQLDHVLEQMDRLRAIMREKEIDLLKSKHENMILKQIERRQQKEIEQLDIQSHDAPKIIRGLREEITGLKSKLRTYYTQINSEIRRTRTCNEECLKLRDTVSRLQHLTDSQSLLEREELTKRVSEANEKLAIKDALLSEMSRKNDLVEKLLTNENRALRGKIHNLTAENLFLKDKIQKSADTIQAFPETAILHFILKDRDKEIASLSIYRYNAVHKKVDQIICKKCEQREKEESESKRRQLLFGDLVFLLCYCYTGHLWYYGKLDKIPMLPPPNVSIINGNSVEATIMAPFSNPKTQVEYEKLTLKVTSDPIHSSVIKEYNIPIKKFAENSINLPDKNNFIHTLVINGLTSGKYYQFLLVASCEGIDGNLSIPVSVLVDQLPAIPPKPYVAHSIIPPIIQLFIEPAPLTKNNASIPSSFQIYHSNDPTMTELFLIGEIPFEAGKKMTFVYNNVRIGTTHYFKVAAVNSMGVGELSEISDVVIMDIVPNRPSKPHISKLDSKSARLITSCDPHGGTDIDNWKIFVRKIGDKEDTANNKYSEVAVKASGKAYYTLDYVIDKLFPGETYVFQVTAVNIVGDSDISEESEPVNLDMLVPVPDQPKIHVLSPTSVKFFFHSNAKKKYGNRPKLTGYRILGYHDFCTRTEISTICGIKEKYFVLDGLDYGVSYNFALKFIGENAGEGNSSELTFVPLAAGIPLPPSPNDNDRRNSLETFLRDDPESPNPGQLKKSKSKSLSLTQRSQNMHDGNPAFLDPESGDIVLPTDQSAAEKIINGKKLTAMKSTSNVKQHSKAPAQISKTKK
ncbi:Lebercilin [Physocladia obscura]|uniref:Lebercilin n=1 Tax=Physocladia obscura TaxID=109957 RepID=A0AAD5XD77_9FUNG|nr:Lebercilin [Physocladia obscura]